MLRLLPTYQSSPLVRTRDPEVLAKCHTVVDVGGEYEAERNRYDHHQRTFDTTLPNYQTKLSSAGLVWKHFGRDIVQYRTGLGAASQEVELVYDKVYRDFVEAVDANDNGISPYDPAANLPPKRFNDHGVTLASLVSDLNYDFSPDDAHPPALAAQDPNPAQKAAETLEQPLSAEQVQAAEDAKFGQASRLMGTTLLRKLNHAATSWLPARAEIGQAYGRRHEVDPSGKFVVLEAGGIPWKEHLYNFEKEAAQQKGLDEAGEDQQIYFVLYPEKPTEGSKWRVQAVSVNKESFTSRKPLKEDWRGVRDAELSTKSGIPGCVFCHASGFIGGNETREGALEMARQSLAA